MKDKNDALISPTDQERLQLLERKALPDRVSNLLRDSIVNGRIPPGTRLIERQLAKDLQISRVPIREALIQLEIEGLVTSRHNGRYVIEISERDIHQLFEVRLALERLAVKLATQNTTPERAKELRSKMQAMRNAGARNDIATYVRNDFEIHQLIWDQAENHYLNDALKTLTGPIYMFITNNSGFFGWEETLDLHEDLIESINSGDPQAAEESIELHMKDGIRRAYLALNHRKEERT